ncbi:MAG: hypothetical protein A2452_13300 [Candidatus Firestonebacteria bacterium RIFOXYC2_FULL_39_67]|nr:MAG: hypothetical protein A2536_01160 [Candidatus Firestonebacteria bacterium RIFOXYD2_FULL_39_29]OGF56295.1 MAG: hypothetical protein A2452_13300 [Candidatus Firestonebacteria bacterium RIFOXYC2_FULL_39_67]
MKNVKQNKILLVDDDSILRSEFKDCFEEYDITEAVNGDMALSILKKPNEIDLVILDVRMPGKSGLEILKNIREIDKDVKIIIFTGYGSKEVVVSALRAKADDFIEKPLDVDSTRDVIEKVLSTKKGLPESDSMDLKDKMEKVKGFIERNYLKKITLNDAANVVGLSPKYLSRMFQVKLKMGFSDYKLNLKINKSKEFLKKTGYNVDQIAYKLAYENSESFIRQFKKITGSTPTEYRKRVKK